MTQGAETGNDFGLRLDIPAAQVGKCHVHVPGVREHNHVDDETQRPELVLLALAIELADLVTLAVKN